MTRRAIVVLAAATVMLMVAASSVWAGGYRWRDHARPFDFEFENHFDTHQQTQLIGQNQLQGFFYIQYTGDATPDGVPIAEHGDCSAADAACLVGWKLHGIAMEAEYCDREDDQHPTWAIPPDDMPAATSGGGYSHFHWLNESDHASGLTVGDTYEGVLLRTTANENFFFDHHGGFLIEPGIDTASHANLVPVCPDSEGGNLGEH